MRCQLDLSARIAGLISSVLFCVTFLIVFKQYPGLFFVRLSTTKHWWRSLSPIDHGFFEFCLYFVYVAFSVVHSSAATLSLKNSQEHSWFLQAQNLLGGRTSPTEVGSARCSVQAYMPFCRIFRFYTCSFCSCSMLDFSFDCSEDFDINAFEDIISFYENKK